MFSQFSLQKLVGRIDDLEFKLDGCTTDSGGGGTGYALYRCMDNLGLCRPVYYLVQFCILHILQLSLCNAIHAAIGQSGIGYKNALQLIYTAYSLQQTMDWEDWVKEWKLAAEKVGHTGKIVKLDAPVASRWWTIGNASIVVVDAKLVYIVIATKVRNANASDTADNKIASSFLSQVNCPIIFSDTILIRCYHISFLNTNFKWFQNGDEAFGNTPGHLARLVLSRYYIIISHFDKVAEDGWKQVPGYASFYDSISQEDMQTMMDDPDTRNQGQRITYQVLQERKAKLFFYVARTTIEKHLNLYCGDLFFFSLYGEPYSTMVGAKLLIDKDATFPEETVRSTANQCSINVARYAEFLKSKVDFQAQKDNVHIKLIDDHTLGLLAGKYYRNWIHYFIHKEVH